MKTATTQPQTSTDNITWQLDSVHSHIAFSVSHMVISHVKGSFRKFEGSVQTNGENFETGKIELTIDASSIDTNNEQRDKHLRSSEFIDVSKNPKIIFKSNSIKKVNDKNFTILGDLTINGVTKQVELNAKFNGIIKDPYNNIRAGFKISGEINRKNFGVNWHATLDTGGLIAGDDIEIMADVEVMHS